MAMVVGQARLDPVTGLAGRIYTAWTGAGAEAGLSPLPVGSAARKMVAAQCEAIATAVIAEIQANATVTVKPTDAGLQRDHTTGTPATLAPVANVVLPGGAVL